MSLQATNCFPKGRGLSGPPEPGVGDAASLRARAEARAAQGLWEEAVADCTTAIELDFSSVMVVSAQVMLLAGRSDLSAVGGQAQQLRALQESLAASYLLRGTVHAGAGHDERAYADFSHILRLVPDHAAARAARGEVSRRLGNFEQALTDFSAAIHLDPAPLDALCGRGALYLELGEPSAAVDDFTLAIGLDSSRVSAYIGRGRALAEMGEVESARADLDRAIQLQPDAAAAFFHRGCCHARLNDAARALADLDRALSLDPGQASAYLARARVRQASGQLADALLDFDEYLLREPNSVAAFVDRGRLHRDQANYDQAAADFSEALRLAPAATEVYLHRALTLCLKGDRAAAAADLAEAIRRLSQPASSKKYPNQDRAVGPEKTAREDRLPIQDMLPVTRSCAEGSNGAQSPPTKAAIASDLNPALPSPAVNAVSRAEAEFLRGAAAREKGDLDAALAMFAEALRLDPGHAKSYRERGRIYRTMKRTADAVEQFTRAVHIDPADVEAWLGRANAYAEAGELDAAIADYTAILRNSPGLTVALQNRAYVLAKKGEFDQAADDADEALQLSPESARGHWIAGLARAGLEQFAAALAHFDRAAALSPRDPVILHERGLVRARMGDLQGALIDYQQALELRPSFHLARYNQANALRESGSYSDALAALEEVIRHQPNKTEAYYQRAMTFYALGDHHRAIADLDRALRINPALTAASALRLEVLRAARAVAAPSPDLPVAAEEPAAKVAGEHPPRCSLGAASGGSEDTGIASIPNEATRAVSVEEGPADAARTDRRRAGMVRLVCPQCGRSGKAAWNRLGKAFHCEACGCIARPDGTGRLTKIIPTKSPPGPNSAKKTAIPDSRGNTSQSRVWRNSMAALAGACVLAMIAFLLAMFRTSQDSSLQTRGVDLTRAWLSQDVTKMRELTDAESVKNLEGWLLRNPPPEAVRSEAGARARVEVSVERTNGMASDIAAKIEPKAQDGGASQVIVVYWHWVQRDGHWYFAPDGTDRRGGRAPARKAKKT